MRKTVVYLMLAAGVTLCEMAHSMEGQGLDYEDVLTRFDYNPATVKTVRGRVTKINNYEKITGMGSAIVLTVKTQEGEVEAILGPEWYIQNQQFDLKDNQYVSMVGSAIEKNNKHYFVVAHLTHNDKELNLRDEKTGKPQWSEWRKDEGIFYKNYNR